MSNLYSANQLRRVRLLSRAKLPMLAAVVFATILVVRVPFADRADSRAETLVTAVQPRYQVTDPTANVSSTIVGPVQADEDELPHPDAGISAQTDLTVRIDVTDSPLGLESEGPEADERVDHVDAEQPVDSSSPSTSPGHMDDIASSPELRPDVGMGEKPPWLQADLKFHETTSAQELRVHNLIENRLVVRFVADGKSYSLRPGQSIELTGKESWQIRFHRGADFGNSQKTIQSGIFVFSISDQGWTLREKRPANEARERQVD